MGTNKINKRKKDELLHIRVGEKIREQIDELINSGLFTSQTELVREAVRDLILRYKRIQWNDYPDTFSREAGFKEIKSNNKNRVKRNKRRK